MPAETAAQPALLKPWMSVTAALENLAGEFTQAFLAERNPNRSHPPRGESSTAPQRLALQQGPASEGPGFETLASETAIPNSPPATPAQPSVPVPALGLQGLNYKEALSRTFSPQELELTGWLRGAELREEYAIMRLFLLRMMQMTAGIETLAEMIEFINIYGMSLLRLARILETLNGGEDAGERLTRDLLEVADQVLKEKQQARFQEADNDSQDF